MIETKVGICVYKYKLEIIKLFYSLLYIFFSFARGGKYLPIHGGWGGGGVVLPQTAE